MSLIDAVPATGQSLTGLLQGPAGRLECMLSAPDAGEARGLGVVCHPHPLYGGTMANKVVHTLARVARSEGLLVACFNFRGVGESEGTYGGGEGEAEDAIAVARWLRQRRPGLPLVLQGFSFGAHVGLRIAGRLRAAALVTVSIPSSGYLGSADCTAPGCPWLALHSRDDDVVAYAETAAMLARYEPPAQLVTLEGAGHFWHGHLNALRRHVAPFLSHVLESHGPAHSR